MKAILQLGDISEGLAGDSKAEQMAAGIVKTIEDTNMPVPWIITKGNHDVTSGTPQRKLLKLIISLCSNVSWAIRISLRQTIRIVWETVNFLFVIIMKIVRKCCVG